MLYISATLAAVLSALLLQSRYTSAWSGSEIPKQAQFMSPKSWAVLDRVPPTSEANGTTVSTVLRLGLIAVLLSPWNKQRVT